ncbi:MAG: transporter substrate-binding domain-containing protein [Arcobacteraceae bacterium]|nr:transporter substrate-binding domain-containing protein [Arcobacteraceae bacterium]
MNQLKKIIFIFISLLLSANILFANNNNLEKVSLQLQWLDQFQFAGYYIAKEKGFYKEVGLDVEIKKFDYDILTVDEVVNKKATYGIGRSSLIIDKSKGTDIKILASIFQSSPLILLATKDSGIKTVKDFIGKRIMVTKEASKTASLRAMINKKRIFLKDLITLPHTFNINDLIDKKTDLMVSYISNEPYYLNKQKIEYIIFDPKNYGFDFYSDILFTSGDEILYHPNRVNNFTNASLKGWKYAFNNIEETVELILKKYNSQNKSKNALIYEAKELKKLAYYKIKELGHINAHKIQRIYDIYNVMGFVNNEIDIDKFIIHENKYKTINLTKKEKEYLSSHPIIKAHNEASWPPFNFKEEGNPKGFSIDYMNLLAKKLNIKVEYISGYSWSEFMNMLQTPALDVIINISKNEQRAKTISFTDTFYTAQNAIYVHKNNPNFNKIKDLENKTIAMPKGFFAQKFMEKYYPNIKQILVKNQVDALKLLSLEKVDATIGKKVVMDYIIRNNNISEVLAVGFIEDKRVISQIRLGVSKKDKILRDILQKAQDKVSNKELRRLKQKWFGVKSKSLISTMKLTKKEKRYLKNKKSITMCIDPYWMPFESFIDGKHVGMSADYSKIFQKNIGIPINVIQTNTWSETLEFAKQKKCDIISLAMETSKRKKYMNFTTPYLKIPLIIATKPNVPFIADFKNLTTQILGIPKGYAFIDILRTKYPHLNIIEVDNVKDGLQKVKKGKIFGYIGTLASVGYLFQKDFTGELKIAGKFDEKWELGTAVRNDDKVLLEILQKVIDNIDKSTHKHILTDWITIKYEELIDYTFVWQILAIMIIIFILLMYRQKELKDYTLKLEKSIKKYTNNLKKKNKRLKESVESFEYLIDTAIECIAIFDENRNIIQINSAGIKMFKFDNLNDAIGTNIKDLIPKHEEKKIKKALSTPKKSPYEVDLLKKDKTVFPALAAGRDIVRNKKRYRLTTVIDLSEIKQKDKMIQQQSKLALMGEMISMIAHQWRQPLNIIGAINMKIETKLDFNETITAKSYAPISEDINKQLEFMSKTIDDFRNFFKPNKEKQETSYTELLNSSLGIVAASVESKYIEIKKELNCEDRFSTYTGEVTQVILNIIKNAEDILLERDIKAPYIKLITYKENDETLQKEKEKYILEIIDNGGGIPEDIIDKIFDPYFSTKSEKHGTGLGLYMSKTIIEEHCGGKLTAQNKDNGVVFKISL